MAGAAKAGARKGTSSVATAMEAFQNSGEPVPAISWAEFLKAIAPATGGASSPAVDASPAVAAASGGAAAEPAA
eukprot:15035432-Alexandrium_andersonii.AAC.1